MFKKIGEEKSKKILDKIGIKYSPNNLKLNEEVFIDLLKNVKIKKKIILKSNKSLIYLIPR